MPRSLRFLLLIGLLCGLVPDLVSGQTTPINSHVVITGTVNTCLTGPTGTTANAYACTLGYAITSYQPNACYAFVADVANTGSATINLHSLGAKTISKVTGGVTTPLVANDIRANQRVEVCYDNVNDRMQMASPLGNAPIGGGVTTDTAQRAAFYDTTTTVDGATALTFSSTGDTITSRADRITTKNATAALGTGDGPTVACTGGASDVTLTLPAGATTTQRQWTIVKVDSGAGQCLVKANGTETINGSTGTMAAATQRSRVDVALDQTTGTPNWSGVAGKTAIDLTTDVTGILPSANGGTTNAFFAVSGPATSAKTFTFPNANSTMSVTIASGTKALQTGAIASAACATESTVTATGAASSDVVTLTFASDPTAVTGYIPSANGMLTIIAWLTTNTLNLKTCNNTTSSITPGAITLNYRIIR